MKRLLACVLLVTLLVSACPTGLSEEKTEALQYGSQGENVTLIQQRLSDLGYYVGKISGNFLEGTRVAVKKFQKDAGIYQTGEADVKTQEALYADILAAHATPEPTAAPDGE